MGCFFCRFFFFCLWVSFKYFCSKTNIYIFLRECRIRLALLLIGDLLSQAQNGVGPGLSWYIYNPNPNNNIWKLNEDDYENMIKAAWTGKYFDDILNTWVDGYIPPVRACLLCLFCCSTHPLGTTVVSRTFFYFSFLCLFFFLIEFLWISFFLRRAFFFLLFLS